MSAAAFTLALGAAFLHALWNLLLARERDPEPATAIAIAAYTLVDKWGIRYASPIVYLELGLAATALGALLLVALLPSGRARLRAAFRATSAVAGVVSFIAFPLVLAALERAPAASVAAVRETSVLF